MSKDTINNLPLVQKYFGLKENKSVMNLLGSDYWDEMPDDLSRNEFLVYLDLPRPVVLLRLRGGKTLSSRIAKLPSFKEVLMQFPELNFDSILFALTLYGTAFHQNPHDIINSSKDFKSIPLIDDILKPTNGYVLFAHQFEQIYSRIPSASETEVVTLRKDWNKKKPDAIELVKQTEITPGLSFYDLLLERTIEENHFVWNANFKGAKLLWNYINKIQKSKFKSQN